MKKVLVILFSISSITFISLLTWVLAVNAELHTYHSVEGHKRLAIPEISDKGLSEEMVTEYKSYKEHDYKDIAIDRNWISQYTQDQVISIDTLLELLP